MLDTREHPSLHLLRHEYEPLNHSPGTYLAGALPVLTAAGVLARQVTDNEQALVCDVLRQLAQLGLDETDVFPFAVLWTLAAVGAVDVDPRLREQLCGWRDWEEQDHLSQPMPFLPTLPDIRGLAA